VFRNERCALLLHQGMWEAHFGSIHCAIAGSFDDGEERREVWISNDLIDRVLVVAVG
jgi:hypothetical protein